MKSEIRDVPQVVTVIPPTKETIFVSDDGKFESKYEYKVLAYERNLEYIKLRIMRFENQIVSDVFEIKSHADIDIILADCGAIDHIFKLNGETYYSKTELHKELMNHLLSSGDRLYVLYTFRSGYGDHEMHEFMTYSYFIETTNSVVKKITKEIDSRFGK